MKTLFWTSATILVLVVSGCSGLLYYPSHDLYYDPKKIHAPAEDVWFNSLDGTKLNGWLLHHKDKAATKAVVVFFHGNGENMSSHYVTLLWVLEHGYDYFIFDYHGYGRSDGEPSPQSTTEDGIAAIRWVRNRYPRLPVVLFGQSLGGAVAMKCALTLKQEMSFPLIVVESTFSSYKQAARSVLAQNWFTWLLQPFTYFLLSDHYAPDDQIKDLSPTPLIVIHGTKDSVIDWKLGREVYELAGNPKEFWEVPEGGHTEAFMGPQKEIYRQKFLGKLSQISRSGR